jgi:hypothetical protein
MEETGLEASDLTTLVPLLLLLVGQFSSLMRNTGDSPSDLIGVNPLWTPVSLLGGNRDDHSGVTLFPRTGRINAFHMTNVALLFSAFVLILAAEQGLIRNILGLVIAIVWIQLPVIEIDEYDDIRNAGIPPVSLYWHIITTFVAVTFAATSGGYEPGRVFMNASEIWSKEGLSFLLSGHALVGTVLSVFTLIGVGGFLKTLEWELQGATQYRKNTETVAGEQKEVEEDDPDTGNQLTDTRDFNLPSYVANAIDSDESEANW